ncbi:MAG: sensor histidine kinase [Flavobacteriales bacterium]|nr:sensor histidine kinase [Flavobacteriales bacterium]
MKKVYILILFLIVHQNCFAQRFNSLNDDQKFIDSIASIIKTTKDDSIRSLYSFKLSDLYRRNKEMQKFEYYLKIGNANSNKYDYLKDISSYYNALHHIAKGETQIFGDKISKTLNDIKKYKFKASYEMQAQIAQNLSIVKRIQDNEKESMRLLVEVGIPAALKSKNHEIISDLYKLVGIALMNIADRTKANFYLQKAVNHIEKANKSSPVLLEAKVELYIITSENLIYLNKNIEGKKYLQKAHLILNEYPNSNLNGLYYYSEGLYFHKLNNYYSALKSYEKGINNCLLNEDYQSLNRLKFVKYQALFELKKYKEAKEILLDLIKSKHLFASERKNYYKEIAKIGEETGNYKEAYLYINKYANASDSIFESQSKNKVLELESKFNKIENEKKIKELESQKQKSELVSKNNTLIHLIFGLITLILLLIVYFLWKNFNTQKLLSNEKEKNYKQNLQTLKNQKELEIIQAMIDGEELERKRIARELHDGIGSKLSALKIMLSRLSNNESHSIDHINQLIGSSINELRQIAYNLVPESLLKLGLEKALGDLCHLLHSEQVKIEFQSFGIKQEIPISNQINIYRIVQELINNALKHSRCSEILVSCSQNENTFFISVEDNGKGYNPQESESKQGLGIKNLRSRVEMLKGVYHLESNETGTYYNIELKIDS